MLKKMKTSWKKGLILLMALSMIAGLVTGCSNKKEEDISKKKVFIVGFDASFPPYGYKDDNGEYVGFDLDLAQEVCNRNGWTLKKQPIDWDSKVMELNSGSIDCIWNGFTINGREDEYTWSGAYVDNSQVVVVSENSSIKTLSDLKNKVVVVQEDSSALAAFTGDDATEENKELAKSFKELQQVGDYNSAFLNLESGTVQAICMDNGVANYQLTQRSGKFRVLKEVVSTEQYGIGFRLGNTELRDVVQKTLQEMKEDGTMEEIADKYSDYHIKESICFGDEGTEDAYNLDSDGHDRSKNKEKPYIQRVWDVVKQLSSGIVATLLIFVLTLVFSMPLGLLICGIRRSKSKILSGLAKIYISIMRGTPLMLQLLVVFFGPYYIFGMSVSAEYRFYAVIIGFSLNYAAYFAEIYRSGIDTIPVGQSEAAFILGYSRTQTFCKIIFPQMVRRVLPSVTNEIITLVKDTSLAFALAYTEMFTLAKQVAAAKASIMPLFIAGIFYYIFNFVVAAIMDKIEKKMQYFR